MRRSAIALAVLSLACAGARLDPPAASATAPLASFAAVRMIVLPAQGLRADSMGWSARAGEARGVLASVDTALEAALRERGLGTSWAFPTDLARTARRNPMHAVAPGAIRAGDAARVMERRSGTEIPEPAASQLRALAGFHDARHALVPVELRFEPQGSGVRAVLHVVVLDVRASRLAWIGDIASEAAPAVGPAVVTELARRFADLIVLR